MQKVMNFCARVLSGPQKHDHVSDVLRDLKWLDATNLALYRGIWCVRRIIESGQPSGIACALVCATDHGHNSRNARRLRLPRIR